MKQTQSAGDFGVHADENPMAVARGFSSRRKSRGQGWGGVSGGRVEGQAPGGPCACRCLQTDPQTVRGQDRPAGGDRGLAADSAWELRPQLDLAPGGAGHGVREGQRKQELGAQQARRRKEGATIREARRYRCARAGGMVVPEHPSSASPEDPVRGGLQGQGALRVPQCGARAAPGCRGGGGGPLRLIWLPCSLP